MAAAYAGAVADHWGYRRRRRAEADLGAAPPQPQPAAAAAAAGAAAARPMAIDATSRAEALRQALAEWPVEAKLWYTDTSGGPDLELTLVSVEKVELRPEDEAGRDYHVRTPSIDSHPQHGAEAGKEPLHAPFLNELLLY